MRLARICSAIFAAALVLAGLVPVAVGLEQAASQGGRYALLVGVRKYDPNELHALAFAEPDVVDLAGALMAGGYTAGNVVLMTQTVGAEDTRFLPLGAHIRKELHLLLSTLDENDSVIIALAGHGVQFQGEAESYFCPLDARLSDRSTLIPLSEIYKAIESSRAGLKILLVDACRDDPQTQNSRSRNVVKLESVTRHQAHRPPAA